MNRMPPIEVPFSYEIADPRVLGLAPERIAALVERARREVDAGLLPSCQLAMAKQGRLVLFATLGAAAPGSRYVIFSCTKALVASALWILIGEGKVDAAQRVAEVVPEFGTNGKERITIEQLLLHSGGFPRAPLGPPRWHDRHYRLEQFSRWRLNWEPGTRIEYHPTSAHWVIAEIVERLSGTDYRRFVRERIVAPLGLRGLDLGVPRERQADINTIHSVGEPATPEEVEKVLGFRLELSEVGDDLLLGLNDPGARAVGLPGGGAVASAADVALFYQALLHNPARIWDSAVLADVTGRVRTTMIDIMTGVPASRSLGLVIAGDDGLGYRRGMGHNASPRTFGHNGAGGQIAWADPQSGISFCYLTNGLDRNILRQGVRTVSLSNRAADCAAP